MHEDHTHLHLYAHLTPARKHPLTCTIYSTYGTAQMTTTQSVKQQMKYLKQQRKFLVLLGVLHERLPVLQYKSEGGGKKICYTPDEFCKKVGEIIDRYAKGDFI